MQFPRAGVLVLFVWKLGQLPVLGVVAGREGHRVLDNSHGAAAVHAGAVLLAVTCPFICLGAEGGGTARTQQWQQV